MDLKVCPKSVILQKLQSAIHVLSMVEQLSVEKLISSSIC